MWLNTKDKLSGLTTAKVLDSLDGKTGQMYSFTTQRFNRPGTKRSKKVTKSSSTLSRGKKDHRRKL